MNTAMPVSDSAVSVIVPVYNRATYLRAAVDSALAQDHPHVDVIIADDGSTDAATRAELETYAGVDRVTVLHLEHGGLSAARNAAIRHSTATYVLPLDDDDLIEPSYVRRAVAVLDDDETVGVVYCQADMFGAIEGPWQLPQFTMRRMLIDNCIFASSVFRRRDWERAGGFDTKLTAREDHDFFLRLLALGLRPVRIDAVLFHYRQHYGTMNQALATDRERLVRIYATVFRNNADFYLDQAEEFWHGIFALKDETNDLRHRYARLERLRTGAAAPLIRLVKRMRRRAG